MRKIILFTPLGVNESAINQAGALLSQWQVDSYCRWDDVHENYSNYLLGLFFVSDEILQDQYLLDDFETQLCKVSQIDWIALVCPGQLDTPLLEELLARYAADYISLPITGAKKQIDAVFGHLYGMAELRRRSFQSEQQTCEKIVGNCSAMREIYKIIPKLAVANAPVLIGGESGTGKELIAQTLHQQSTRKSEPFIALNCGAIPENLVESELFGHVKGAFTGADENKIGKIELAHRGVLFLDEIGDLPLSQQVKLLRFLQEGTINPVGMAKTRHVDVRVIAASHVNLEEAMSEGRFRPDLFYRLNVLQIYVPALRDRMGDVEILARHFLKKYRNEGLGVVKGFSKEAVYALKSHAWPGNIRELMNRIRKASILCENSLISANDLGLLTSESRKNTDVSNLGMVRNLAEKLAVIDTLSANGHNISKTAEQLGVSRMTLYRLMSKHQITSINSTAAAV